MRIGHVLLRWVLFVLACVGLVLMHTVVIGDLHSTPVSEPVGHDVTAAVAAADRLPGADHASHGQAAAAEGIGGGSSHQHDAHAGHLMLLCLAVVVASAIIVIHRFVLPGRAAALDEWEQHHRFPDFGTLGIPSPPRIRLCILRC